MLNLYIFIFLSFSYAKDLSCPVGQHWVRDYQRSAYTTNSGKFVRATHVRAHCQNNPMGYDIWKNQLSDSLPKLWPNISEKPSSWKEGEKEDVLEALGKIPEILANQKIKIYRGNNSKVPGNVSTSAESLDAIILYNAAFASKISLAQILSHEFAHIQFTRLSEAEKEDYRYATNWIEINRQKGLYLSRSKGYVQDDGRDSPEEDYANNVEYLLFI